MGSVAYERKEETPNVSFGLRILQDFFCLRIWDVSNMYCVGFAEKSQVSKNTKNIMFFKCSETLNS